MSTADKAARRPVHRLRFRPGLSPPDPPLPQRSRAASLSSGDAKCRHAARAGRLDTGRRVLDHQAVCGRYAQLRGGEQENFRVGLALPQIATADIGAEDIE